MFSALPQGLRNSNHAIKYVLEKRRRRKEGREEERQERRSLLFKIYLLHQLVIGEGNDNPLQYSCLENPMDRGAWSATVQGAAKSLTQLYKLTNWS